MTNTVQKQHKIISRVPHNGEIFIERAKRYKISKCKEFKRWTFNRVPDESKVNEIKQSIKNHTFAPQPLMANIKDDEVHVYDGGHRLKAYSELYDESPEIISAYLGAYIAVSEFENAPDELINQRFNNLNKSTPASSLYTSQNQSSNIGDFRGFGQIFKSKYPKAAKTSNNPHIPNYNPWALEESLAEFVKDNVVELKNISCEYLINAFEKLNNEYKNRCTNGTNHHQVRVAKAQEAGCFIFVFGRDEWKKDIKKYL